MPKEKTMQDHAVVELFKMPLEDLDGDAKEYFLLRQKEELDSIKRRMEAEQRTAKREKSKYKRLMREKYAEVPAYKRRQTHPTATPTPAEDQASTAGNVSSPHQ